MTPEEIDARLRVLESLGYSGPHARDLALGLGGIASELLDALVAERAGKRGRRWKHTAEGQGKR